MLLLISILADTFYRKYDCDDQAQLSENDEDDVLIDDYSCFDLTNTVKKETIVTEQQQQQQQTQKSKNDHFRQRFRYKGVSETDIEENEQSLENTDDCEQTSTRPPLPPNSLTTPLLSLSSSTSSSTVSSPISITAPVVPPSALNSLLQNSSSYNGSELDKNVLLRSKRGYIKQVAPNSSSVNTAAHGNSFLTKAISTPSIIDKMSQESCLKNDVINENVLDPQSKSYKRSDKCTRYLSFLCLIMKILFK
jgi:hypothetical protein